MKRIQACSRVGDNENNPSTPNTTSPNGGINIATSALPITISA